MTDIVERLRHGCSCNFPDTPCGAEEECRAAFDAADEITRLRADNERLREEAEFGYMTGFDVAKSQYCTMVQKLEDENERLRAALRPFAEAADGFDMTRIKNPEEWFAYRGIVSSTESKGAITVGDLRRARAALDGQPAPGKEEA